MNTKIQTGFILTMLLTFAIWSCKPRPKPPAMKEGIAVAQVGDLVITDQMLLERIGQIEKSFPRVYSVHEQKKALLNEMIHIELLYEEALRKNLDKRFDFKSRLADLYVRDISEEARSKISDQSIKEYYDKNREALDQVSARHILLKTPPHSSASVKSEIKKKLEAMRTQAIQNPDSFGTLAFENSEDGSKTNQGDIGYFTHSMMVKPFADAAFKLKKVGEISQVIETQFGFHLIQLTGEKRNYEFFKEQIKDFLLRASQRSFLDEEIAKLKKDKKIEIYEDNLAKLSPLPEEITTSPEKLIPEKKKGEGTHE